MSTRRTFLACGLGCAASQLLAQGLAIGGVAAREPFDAAPQRERTGVRNRYFDE